AKGVLPEDHPLYAGTLDMACNQFVWKFLAGCDLLLCAGFDAVELIKPWELDIPAIHIDATPNTDQIYPAELELVGPIGAILDSIAEGYHGEQRWTEREVAAHRDGLKAKYYEGRTVGRLNPTDVIDVVRAATPRNTIATSDVGSHKLLVGQGWTTYDTRSTLITNGLSSMGFSLPAAIAAKLVHPDRPVVCFTGDGGLAMVQGELRLAATLKLDPVVVVFCDHGTLIEPTDIVKLAESMGCAGAVADSVAALERLLSAPRPNDRPLVIGAQIDPAQYAAQF
ncbi:MAG: thiamine pyrophosphate-dependent enzyme, partial [Proteobacteria bacterium]|nr:thiamine pyrophosphate-dependent enzyme [Pseudomonadota bacterium]